MPLRFERYGRDVKPELIEALQAYDRVGIRFLATGLEAGGVVPLPLRVPPPS